MKDHIWFRGRHWRDDLFIWVCKKCDARTYSSDEPYVREGLSVVSIYDMAFGNPVDEMIRADCDEEKARQVVGI